MSGTKGTDDIPHGFEPFNAGTETKDDKPDKPKAAPAPGKPPAAPFELTDANDIALANSLTGEAKLNFINVIRDIVELNGTGDIPGIQASYIDAREYVQDFSMVKVSNGMKKALFLAYNWQALGKGAGGLAGSAVRWGLYRHYSQAREMTVHTALPAGAALLLGEYDKAAMAAKDLINFFMTNAISIAALAGAMINRIVHHWDSKHTGAQKAFINSMGMADHLAEDQYRAVFYLAIHPLPLSTTERFRNESAAGSLPEVAEVVRLRCVGPPAGYGAINACAAAVPSLLGEKLMNPETYVTVAMPVHPGEMGDVDLYAIEALRVTKLNNVNLGHRAAVGGVRSAIAEVLGVNRRLIAEAGRYHQFAKKYGHDDRLFVDSKDHEKAMIILAGYIFAKVKGSLAKSAALRKFRDQNARAVQKVISAFSELDEGETIFDVLGI